VATKIEGKKDSSKGAVVVRTGAFRKRAVRCSAAGEWAAWKSKRLDVKAKGEAKKRSRKRAMGGFLIER
jgi:hypothetical protein